MSLVWALGVCGVAAGVVLKCSGLACCSVDGGNSKMRMSATPKWRSFMDRGLYNRFSRRPRMPLCV